MRWTLLLYSSACLAQPTISAISSDFVSHSDARITATASGCTVNNTRIRYGFTSSYDGGAGGGILAPTAANGTKLMFGLSGLVPNTLYHYSTEGSCDGGTTWNTPVDATLTTLALPNVHPALPTPPPAYTPTFPNTAGYNAVSISSGCTGSGASNELQIAVTNAVALQATNGTIITIPAGTICQINLNIPQDTNSAIKSFTSANVSGSTITVTSHGFTNSQAVLATVASGPGAGGQYGGALPGPLVTGEIYYISGATTNTFQLSATAGASAITLLDTGTGGGTYYVAPWPPYNRNAIVIQTATADASFIPPGVRASPVWKPKMATIQVVGTSDNNPVNANVAFNTQPLTHDIWLRGIEITNVDQTALANSTNDPAPTFGYVSMLPDNAYITFDRCYIHNLGAPNRVKAWISPWAGHYVSFINSYMANLTAARSLAHPGPAAASPGLTPSVSAGVLSVTAGTTKLLNGTTCYADGTHGSSAGLTWTRTAGSSTSHGYLEIGLDCTPTLILPTGATASCTGNTNDGTTNRPCATTTQASPNWTLDSTGNARKNFQVGDFVITSGVWQAASNDVSQVSYYMPEGTQSVYAGMGRGPYYFINNFISGVGDIMHMDDQNHAYSANTALNCPVGYLYKRNTFDMPLSTIFDGATSDGFWYEQREPIEWKAGCNIQVTGNIFQGDSIDISPYGGPLWSANSTYQISDIEFSYNTTRNGPGGLVFISVPHLNAKSPPINRIWIHDNIWENMNAWTFRATYSAFNNSGIGTTHGYLIEDMIFDHNTVVDFRGTGPDAFHIIQTPQEGTQISNNIIWGNDDAAHHGWSMESMQFNTPACNNLVAKAGMDCAFTRGVGNTLYAFQANLLVPQYTNSQALTGDAGVATWTTAYAGFVAPNSVIIAPGANPAARVTAIGFINYANGAVGNDFRFPYNGTYVRSGADGSPIGARTELLRRAQGQIFDGRTISITSTGFTAAFWMQDPGNSCYVFYGPSGTAINSMTSRTTDTTNKMGRAIAITGLTTKTLYDWYASCDQATVTIGPFTFETL